MSTTQEVQLMPSDNEHTGNPLRPALGSRGKPASVHVNLFPITQIAMVHAWQYDVSFGGEDVKALPPVMRRRMWPLIESKVRSSAPGLERAHLAFDGTRNCFSTSEIVKELGESWTVDIEYDRILDEACEFFFFNFFNLRKRKPKWFWQTPLQWRDRWPMVAEF
jgi:hypothetical protein